MTDPPQDQPDPTDLAGLGELILQYGHACRREVGAHLAAAGGSPAAVERAVADTDALAKRIRRRVRRLEHLGRMGGIEPSDVRAALVGTWRN